VTEQPIRFLRLQGVARDWSKHNEHSRNIFSVDGFLRLSVISLDKKLYSTLSPPRCIMGTGIILLGVTLRWTNIPSRGE